MRALITGANGFVARYLARELSAAGWSVFGTGSELPQRPASDSPARDPHRPGEAIPPFEGFTCADITDADSIGAAIRESAPDAVFHLAGISHVASAERDPVNAFRVNVLGVVVLLRKLLEERGSSGREITCLVVGSAEQYGAHPESEMPLREEAQLKPVTSYAASKCAQEMAALQVHRATGLRVICTRSFNHSGAGQRPDFLLPALVGRALEVGNTSAPAMPIGNTTPVRDFLHVEDVARAYRLLVERGIPGEIYNVCSGAGLSVGEIAREILRRVGTDARLETREDLVRRVDVPVLVGSNARLVRDTAFEPIHSFNDILEDLILAASK